MTTATPIRPQPPVRRAAPPGRDGPRQARQHGHKRRRRLVGLLLAVVTVVGILFIGVFPTRTWLAQRSTLTDANHQLEVLRQENDALGAQVVALNTDAEIERLARAQHNLVRPGEESYAINPAPTPPVAVPSVWPFTVLAAELAPPPR